MFRRNETVEIDRSSIVYRSSLISEKTISFAVCDDLLRTNQGHPIGKFVTLIDPIVLLFFATTQETLKLNEYEINFSNEILVQLRTKLNACLKRKLQSLGFDSSMSNNSHSVQLLVKIFSNRSMFEQF